MNLRTLIFAYQTDPDSTFHKIRFLTRQNYRSMCRRLERDCVAPDQFVWADQLGCPVLVPRSIELSEITARLILRWHEGWAEDGKIHMGHGVVGMLRTVLTFGATLLEDADCRRIKAILHDMRFEMGKPRKERLTAAQVIAIRRAAHARGLHSIALAQAVAFECTLRQKDVIGEFVPRWEIESDVVDGQWAWHRGIRWSEVDDSFIMRHVTSKRQKVVEINLLKSPMVVEELRLMAGLAPDETLERVFFPWTRPLVISEATGQPFYAHQFRRRWREIASSAGVPDDVYNMDTRAGAITEAHDAGANPYDIRDAATHSDIQMTQKYNRGDGLAKIERVQDARIAARARAA